MTHDPEHLEEVDPANFLDAYGSTKETLIKQFKSLFVKEEPTFFFGKERENEDDDLFHYDYMAAYINTQCELVDHFYMGYHIANYYRDNV